jgi:hypothetical protein
MFSVRTQLSRQLLARGRTDRALRLAVSHDNVTVRSALRSVVRLPRVLEYEATIGGSHVKKSPSATSNRKPPEPADGHGDIDAWMRRVMPDLHPIVVRLDGLIRKEMPKAQYAVKWKKAYYGLPKHGWVIEVVAYDVSVNVVFLGGADFTNPPPLGEGRSRYIKVKSLDDVDSSDLRTFIKQASRTSGWSK